ncbi:maleylpyruvate isomerase family mycothiol-dependent enzyme [Kribbella sp. NPDC051586]|uniref:maleylpyruvate isomerase family mycothiol-dependent enzyme n=1 Tax=Kribbella sp. NPDC051586 TaxID=3364118 RepID=UPI003787CF72
MSNADIVIAALRTGYERLAGLVTNFDEETLAGPSAATEWDIAQVLSHLGSGAEIMANTIQLTLDRKPAADSDFNQNVWARWDSSSRQEQAAGFLVWNEKLITLFESLDDDQRDNLRIDLGYLPAPADVATVARMRLSELTYHSWDVRSASDPGATLDADAVPQMLQATGDLSWITKPANLNGRQAVLTVVTTEPSTEFSLRLDDPVSIDPIPADDSDSAATADGSLTLPAESWLRLIAGRLGPDRTPAAVTLTGPITLSTLRNVFAGY